MAVVTTLAIIGGVSFLIGGAVVSHCKNEKEKKELRKQEIDSDISVYNQLISMFEGVKTKLNTSIQYFEDGKTEFKNGGHVDAGKPLGDSEFSSCINKLNSSVSTINQLISAYRTEIGKLEQEKQSL